MYASENYLNDVLDEGFITDKISKFFRKKKEKKVDAILTTKLPEYIKTKNRIKLVAKSSASEIAVAMKKKDSKKIEGAVTRFVGAIKEIVETFINDLHSETITSLFGKIAASIVGMIIIIFLQLALTLVVQLITLLLVKYGVLSKFEEKPLLYIVAGFVGPITEEWARSIAIKKGMGGTFSVTFSVIESGMYIKKILSMGMSLQTAILMRLPALVMHNLNYFIQRYYAEHDKPNKGLIIAILLHMAFNITGMAVMETKEG